MTIDTYVAADAVDARCGYASGFVQLQQQLKVHGYERYRFTILFHLFSGCSLWHKPAGSADGTEVQHLHNYKR